MAKVKIQGNASGTGVLTVTAPNTSTDRTITLPDATGTLLNSDGDGSSLTGVGVDGISSSATATTITIDSDDQVGIRTTPRNFLSSYASLSLGGKAFLWAVGDEFYVGNNAYHDGSWKYTTTDQASYIKQVDGTIKLEVAPSGSADSAITWTTAMTIDNAGIITKPAQPAFLLNQPSNVSNVTGNGTIYTFVGTEVFDQNGDCTTTTFTAPVTGRYHFDVSMCFVSLQFASDVYVDVVTSNRTYRFNPAGNNPTVTGNTSYPVITASFLADMDASDTAYVKVMVNGVGADSVDVHGATSTSSFFSGYLVA